MASATRFARHAAPRAGPSDGESNPIRAERPVAPDALRAGIARDQRRAALPAVDGRERCRHLRGAGVPGGQPAADAVERADVHVRALQRVAPRAEHVRAAGLRAAAGGDDGDARLHALLFVVRARRRGGAHAVRAYGAARGSVRWRARRHVRVLAAVARRGDLAVRRDPDASVDGANARGQRDPGDGRAGRGCADRRG